jgi:hypothetical protein
MPHPLKGRFRFTEFSPFPAVVGRLTNKNGAQLSSENKNSYFEVCIAFSIMLNSSRQPISVGYLF